MAQPKELESFVQQNFGLQIVGGRKIEVPTTSIDRRPDLLTIESTLVDTVKKHGSAECDPNSPQGREFIESLGATSVVRLVFPITGADKQRREVFATITPDSNPVNGTLRFAFLGKIANRDLSLPPYLDPLSEQNQPSPTRAEAHEIKRRKNFETILKYLSGANQLGTVGEHDISQLIPIVDPRHLLNAMAEFNIGTNAHQEIQNTDPSQRKHIGDTWEKQRAMLPKISGASEDELIWAPFTFTPIVPRSQRLPFTVRLSADLVEGASLMRGKLVPSKANIQGALEALQNMGFATLLKKKQTDNLARTVEQGKRGI